MAWSWSHSNEAYTNAYNNLCDFSKERLEIIWAEWLALDEQCDNDFNTEEYNRAFKLAPDIHSNILADAIWGFMKNQAICDNGGYKAWCCPFGCDCHKVSFDYGPLPD